MRSVLHDKKGSATVEAVVSFVGFILVIFTILGMARLCQAQMIISTSVDTAAKELSQYSYFYKMSGLQKFDKKLSSTAEVGKDSINTVVSSVDTLYSALGNAYDQTVEDATNLANATQNNPLDVDAWQSTLTGLQDSANSIEDGVSAVKAQFEQIGDNPILYMKSLVSIAADEGMELAKRALAVCLSEYFVEKTMGAGTDDLDAMLKGLGVVDGKEGLKFNNSSIFCDDQFENIEIVVVYELKVLTFFDWEILKTTVCKRASCRAWLGGDNVKTKIKTEDGEADSEGDTGDSGETEQGADADNAVYAEPQKLNDAWAVEQVLCLEKGGENRRKTYIGVSFGSLNNA